MELQKWKIFQHLDPVFAADVKRAYLVGISSLDDDDEEEDGDEEDELRISPCSGGILILKNNDVYFITRDPTSLSLSGEPETRKFLPHVPVKVDQLCGKDIRAVSSGGHHVVVLTTEGRLFQWGYIQVQEKMVIKFKPKFLTGGDIENQRVTQIACGEDHSLALTSEGEVFAWGSNRYRQLGSGRINYEKKPTKISGLNGFDSKISSVACTGWNSFALDTDGYIWSWGDGDDGCLGYDVEDRLTIPLKIPLQNIKMIAAGNTHVLALSNNRELYCWGQHGPERRSIPLDLLDVENFVTTGGSDRSIIHPVLVNVQNVAAIGATRGSNVSVCKTAKGKVYFWGSAYGHKFAKPSPTKFTTIAEVFTSLDSPIMLEPLTFDPAQPFIEKLSLMMKLNFDDKETGDIKFNVEGKLMYAHSFFLQLRSHHFRRMFTNKWKENEEKLVEITEYSFPAFRTFLLYLYTDRIDPPPAVAEDALELFQLADYYGEEDLKGRCVQQLKVLITDEIVSKVYAVSFLYNAKALHDMAVDFIVPNLNSVVKTEEYRKLTDDLKNRLIQELADEHALVGLKRRRKN